MLPDDEAGVGDIDPGGLSVQYSQLSTFITSYPSSSDSLYATQHTPRPFNQTDSTGEGTSTGVVADGACAEYGYGFGWRRFNVLARFQDETAELMEIPNPDSVPIDSREEMCKQAVQEKFSSDHYLWVPHRLLPYSSSFISKPFRADLHAPPDELVEALHHFKLSPTAHLSLTPADRTALKDLRVVELPRLDPTTALSASLSLLDMLLAYQYDVRTTFGEETVESGWTVAKLSPTLQTHLKWPTTSPGGDGGDDDVRRVVIGFIRRALTFPLYRNWELALQVVRDVDQVLTAGECC